MGRFCILCESIRPNEAFCGKGERARICRKCRRMPREKQDALKHEREIHGFLEQSHISEKNVARLRALASSRNTRVADLAALVFGSCHRHAISASSDQNPGAAAWRIAGANGASRIVSSTTSLGRSRSTRRRSDSRLVRMGDVTRKSSWTVIASGTGHEA